MTNAHPKTALLILLFLIAVLLSGIYFAGRSGADPNSYSNDFNVYYFAAREILAGYTPYDHSLSAWTPYLYLPLLAELLVPFAGLPLSVAAYLWFLMSAFSIYLAAWMSASLADSKRAIQAGTIIGALAMLLRFVLDNFDYGQVNTVVAMLAIAHIYFYAKDNKTASMIALALAAAIKLTPLVFIIYHLARRRVKFAAACALLFVAVSALSFAPFGARAGEAFTTFFKRTMQNQQEFNFAYHGNQSLRAAIERWSGNAEVTSPSSLMTTVSGIILLILAVVIAVRGRCEIVASAPFFCLAVLLSPLAWKQHFVMLILPITSLLRESLNEKEKPKRYVLLGLLALIFGLFNLTSPKLIGLVAAEWCDAHSLIFMGAMLLYAWSTIHALQPTSSETQWVQNPTVADKP